VNSRERLGRCYSHEPLDRPGVYVRTGFPDADPTYDRLKAYLNAKTELKSSWYAPWPLDASLSETHTEPYSEDFERLVTILHTPAGDLRASRLVSLKGQPGLQEEHFLKTTEDAKVYLSAPVAPAECDVSGFFHADRQVGDRGIVQVSLGHNPGGAVAELFGSEQFAIMSALHRDVIHALCEHHMGIALDRAKFLLANGVGPYFGLAGEEYIVPPLHGPKDFEDFIVRYDKPILDVVHEAGGRVHVHCHGSIRRVFESFVDMGADVLHPFEAPPMGDITPAEAKNLARGRMCLEGNIQISRMYEATPADIRRETLELIRDAFDDRRGLIVCPTASPYIRGAGEACFGNFKAMIDTVLEWKA